MNRASLVLGTFAFMTNAMAQGSVELMNLPGRVSSTEKPVAVFGGTEQKLDLKIEGIDLQKGTLRAEMFAVAGRLAMPLGKTADLQDGLNLTAATPSRVGVSIEFPPVRAETEMRLRLSVENDFTSAVPLGDLRFAVFPREIGAEIAEMLPALPNGTERLAVFGTGKKLRPALRAMHIPFEDVGETLPGRFDPERFYMDDVSTAGDQRQARDHAAGAKLAVFRDDDSLPPGIYADRVADHILVVVTLPLLDHLAEDPRAQLAFSKIIHLLSSTRPAN